MNPKCPRCGFAVDGINKHAVLHTINGAPTTVCQIPMLCDNPKFASCINGLEVTKRSENGPA